jgi:hypothetical protein
VFAAVYSYVLICEQSLFEGIHHIVFLATCKISMTFSNRCDGVTVVYEMCELEFSTSVFKITEMFLKYYVERLPI